MRKKILQAVCWLFIVHIVSLLHLIALAILKEMLRCCLILITMANKVLGLYASLKMDEIFFFIAGTCCCIPIAQACDNI